ncbi:MAG TPA: hypothetical protein PKD79_01195 [Candidatus Doudnabacteria bacterium]|nr:hypothetical protein [Candidatus Doudnabacteria bacterium]
MNEVISVYKPIARTPLEAIEVLREERPELKDVPITYAGRLDPMAEGLLLVLAGEAVHRKDEFLELPKTYEAQILLGFKTDSYDILGIAEKGNSSLIQSAQITTAVQALVGTHRLPYPAYSSQPVQGKPLWQWARENKLAEIPIPIRKMTVLSAQLRSMQEVPWKEIYRHITTSIQKINGDFRQSEILQSWNQINHTLEDTAQFIILNIKFDVTSGTYIRALACELGQELQTSAILYRLKRTSIGDYQI